MNSRREYFMKTTLMADLGIDRYPIGPDGMLSLKCSARSSKNNVHPLKLTQISN